MSGWHGMRVWVVVGLGAWLVPGALLGQASMFRGGGENHGVFPAPITAASGRVEWAFATDGPVRSSPVIDGDELIVGSGDGTVVALDRRSGLLVWRFQAEGAVHSTPAVAGGMVFFGDRHNRFYALDRASGALRWSVSTGADHPWAWGHEGWDYFTSSPVVVDDRVIVGSGDGSVYAFDASDGRVLWRHATGGRVRSSPAVYDGIAYVGSADGILYALQISTGKEAWRFETTGAGWSSADFLFDRVTIQGSPVVRDGVVFFGSRDGQTYAVDAASGALRWAIGGDAPWFVTTPAVRSDLLVNGSSDGLYVHALDPRTGDELWRTDTGERVFSSPALSGDHVFVGNQAGRFMKLNAGDGTLEWELRLGASVMSSPVVWDGRVYFGCDDGSVRSVRLERDPPAMRAVYWDSTRVAWGTLADHENVRDYLRRRGYEVVDAAGLPGFMEAAAAGGRRSVVVFALDDLPPTVAASPTDASRFREYLEGGGKVVWLGMPPLSLERDSAGAVTGNDRGRTTALLGVDHDLYNVDRYAAYPTEAGRRWGLERWWIGGSGVDPDQVTEVLAVDDDGLASAWVKEYGGGPGTGFVSIWGTYRRLDPGFLAQIVDVAEYGIGRTVR